MVNIKHKYKQTNEQIQLVNNVQMYILQATREENIFIMLKKSIICLKGTRKNEVEWLSFHNFHCLSIAVIDLS